MCVSIGQLVCFHTSVQTPTQVHFTDVVMTWSEPGYEVGLCKAQNDVNDTVGCLHVVRTYSFKKDIKLYILASYIAFSLLRRKIIILQKK